MDAPGELQTPPHVAPHVHSPPDLVPLNTTAVLHDAFAPPEQPAFDLPPIMPPPTFDQPAADGTLAASQDNSQDTSEERAEGDESDGNEDRDDSESDDESSSRQRWYPIEEDKSEPCEDEMSYINSREEHSALDQKYWEELAFFDPNDPEMIPGESGIIDWTIENFNGTKENPNTDRIMRSPTVCIGGYDWCVKFYPHGHGTDYISVFLENVTMQSPDFSGIEEFEELPFPVMNGVNKKTDFQKRRSVAAQVCVVMYNPAEPRTYEHQAEAHQFHKGSTDYGWKYFSRYLRYELATRHHTQRQAMLRNDKLAFRAYIRIVQDPTGCMWDHSTPTADETTAVTGLRPFTKSLTYVAAIVPLLHFGPFRDTIKQIHDRNSDMCSTLQTLLIKMYTRKRSIHHNDPPTKRCASDVTEMLWRINCTFHRDLPGSMETDKFKTLIGSFHAQKGAPCGANRLNTKDYPSIQAAIDNHPKVIACPQLLTLELLRQEHDKTTRKWKKLTNNVGVSDSINVNGIKYTLYAFITHNGHIESYNYTPYVRPRGVGKLWYAYHDGRVTIMTEKQAREKHSGVSKNDQSPSHKADDAKFGETHLPVEEVTCAVMYVRHDVAAETFDFPDEEFWVVPHARQGDCDEMSTTAIHETYPDDVYTNLRGQRVSAEEEEPIAAMVSQAAVESTPEPTLMDGDDVVMRDADDDSEFSVEEPTPDPAGTDLQKGTHDWLGGLYYEGHYNKQCEFHGGGHLIEKNGDEYLGSFKDGRKAGYGKIIFAQTGDCYDGQWLNDMPHGKGKLVEKSTGNVYDGEWFEGRKHGEFVYSGKVTDDDKDLCTVCYTRELNCAFYDCGHVVACYECAEKVKNCPVCRRRVLHRLRIYGVRVSQS